MNAIKLVPLEWKLWKTYLDWINQDEIARLIERYLPVTECEHRAFYENILADKSKIFFSILKVPQKSFIGVCALKHIDLKNRKAELYICLGPKTARGKGYGYQAVKLLIDYAFGTLNLNRIYLYTPEYNRPAIECYRKVGFVREGEFLDDVYRDGRYYNSIRMCYLKKFGKTCKMSRSR